MAAAAHMMVWESFMVSFAYVFLLALSATAKIAGSCWFLLNPAKAVEDVDENRDRVPWCEAASYICRSC